MAVNYTDNNICPHRADIIYLTYSCQSPYQNIISTRAGTLSVSLTAYFQHLEQPLVHGYNRQQPLSKNSTCDILSKGIGNWSKQFTKLILFPRRVPYSALS